MSEHPNGSMDGGGAPPQPVRTGTARRRLLTGGLVSVPVVATLASRPALAANCTVSGMLSGNQSLPTTTPCGGLSPGYWGRKQHYGDWQIFVPTGSNATTFDSVFPGFVVKADGTKNTTITMAQCFKPFVNDQDAFPSTWSNKELLQQVCAAVLNAAAASTLGFDYGYTVSEIETYIIENWNDPVTLNGTLDMLNNRE